MTRRMNRLKFDHDYTKFPYVDMDEKTCRLLQVFVIHYTDLSNEFKRYDTHIEKTNTFYPLPKGKLLLLLFDVMTDWNDIEGFTELFTTIRRWTPEKEADYRSKIGEEFKIVITEK